MKRSHSPRSNGSGEPRKPGEPENQRDRFIEAAKQIGANEDEAAFKTKLAVIARQKPKGDVPEAPALEGNE